MKKVLLLSSLLLVPSFALADMGKDQRSSDTQRSGQGEYKPLNQHGDLTSPHSGRTSVEKDTRDIRKTDTNANWSQRNKMNLSQSRVREIQRNLSDNTSHDLAVDGVWGPRTEQALREFQRENGLPTTGEPDSKTLALLNQE